MLRIGSSYTTLNGIVVTIYGSVSTAGDYPYLAYVQLTSGPIHLKYNAEGQSSLQQRELDLVLPIGGIVDGLAMAVHKAKASTAVKRAVRWH